MIEEMKEVIAYWEAVGIIKIIDSNTNSYIGRAIGFFNGFFILATISGGRAWVDTESIVSIEEMGILIGPRPDKEVKFGG